MRLISAVTTCARPGGVSYLEGTLESLHAAGFDPLVVHDETFAGPWPTLRRALDLCLQCDPNVDAVAVFQDDLVIARNARAWIDKTFWPRAIETIGVCSLYCAAPNRQERAGWFTLDDLAVYRPVGALGYIFPQHSARKLLANPANRAFLSGSDASTATHCRNHGLKYLLHSPSLIEHTGLETTMGHSLGINEDRRAGIWIRDCATMRTEDE